jgi:hypothetical protein
MHELVIVQPPPLGIFGYVFHLVLEVLDIANPVLMEASLPNRSGELIPNRKRETALDTLHAPLHGLSMPGRKQNMQMFRHNRKSVQPEPPLFLIAEYGFHQELGVCGSKKKRSSLERHCDDGVSIDLSLSGLWFGEAYLRG